MGAFHCVQHKTGVFLHDLLKGLLHRADCIPFGMCTELETKFAVKDTLSFNLWPILSFSYTATKVCIPINPLNPYRVLILRKRIRIIRGVYKNINTKHTLTYTQTKNKNPKPQ